ncbi:SDR family oxidoreductase [Roseateles sp.]|uniref:SDR family oxidoreductase n=1 Tax=Roseateles sp. TaxID=1971397 RepID=UPI002E0CAE21|nr:SDR family oxidoreductase [Roseateles sp.]
MKIKGSVALVTGANRGLGAAFARALLAGGAAKVYAAARNPAGITQPGVVPVPLDVTKPDQVAALARDLKDVTLLVNNAGIFEAGPLLAPNAAEALLRQIETNAVGPLRLVQAFAPVLAANGGGAVVNMLSVLSWLTIANVSGTYSASKAAAWALSNALRQELKGQGTALLSVHAGFIDTDMASGVQMPKTSPDAVARLAFEALEAGDSEVLVDEITRNVRAGFGATPAVYLGAGA